MPQSSTTFVGGTTKTVSDNGDVLFKIQWAPQPTKRSQAQPLASNSDMETDTGEEKFEAVRTKKKKQKVINSGKSTPIVLKNKFEVLTDTDDEEEKNSQQKEKTCYSITHQIPRKTRHAKYSQKYNGWKFFN